MFSSILTKTIYEKRWTILFWSLGVIGMALLMMGFYHSFQDFDQVLKNLPKSFQSFIGNIASLKTVPGYVSQQVFAFRIPLLTLIMIIILFSGLIGGDENEGTLQTLLAQPASRLRVFVEKLLAGLVISFIICSAAMIGVLLGLVLIHERMSFLRLFQAIVGEWLITIVFGSLAFAIGAITGKRGLAGSLTGLLAFGTYLLTSFVSSVPSIATLEKISPFHYYNNPAIALFGLDGRNLMVLMGIIVILLGSSALIFNRRDIYQK